MLPISRILAIFLLAESRPCSQDEEGMGAFSLGQVPARHKLKLQFAGGVISIFSFLIKLTRLRTFRSATDSRRCAGRFLETPCRVHAC
jgi:hypothetical protein